MSSSSKNGRPKELPLLEIRKRVLFPGVLLRLQIGRPKSVRLVESIWDAQNRTFKKGSMIAVCTVHSEGGDLGEGKDGNDGSGEMSLVEIPEKETTVVYGVGTVARVLQLSRVNGTDNQSFQFSLLVEGVARMKVDSIVRTDPYHLAEISWLGDIGSVTDTDVRALSMTVRKTASELLELQRKSSSKAQLGKRTKEVIDNLERASPGRLADLLSANLDASVEEKQEVLNELELAARLRKVLELMNRQIEVFKVSEKIQNEVEGKLKNTQREYYLRQQLKAINDELGQINGKGGAGAEQDEMEVLEESLEKAQLPVEVKQVADREMQRLRGMQPSSPEYHVIRTYLELVAELPWNVSSTDNLNIENARDTLDADHFGLEKVKKRIIEFLAVRSLKQDLKGPILCLVGPPGVGKTSLGKSVASSLGRKFRRLALGGVRDEAELRGHRKTYIGAMCGNIIQSIKRAGTNNPVILLDEVDKLGRDQRGDPASALLEILDPEQNDSFVDHYLNVPFDLSKVLFIATANRLDTIPGPLMDRMEVIELPGYTLAEKHEIASQHLIKKQMDRHGLTKEHIDFTPKALDKVIESYTREAGVRSLDREIGAICRFGAVKVAESRDRHIQAMVKEAEEGGTTSAAAMMQINELVDEEAGSIPPPLVVQVNADGEQVEKQQPSVGVVSPLAKPQQAEQQQQHHESVVAPERPIVVESDFKALIVTPEVVEQILGPPKYESEVAQRTAVPGVSTGLAYTSFGGDILFIEAWLHRGSGRIQLTGQLGKVMEESVRAALSFVRGNLAELQLANLGGKDVDLQHALARADIHIHFPAGAIPKDGPSAGVAVTAAILSAISGRCVRPDSACTGEITLRGLVLPVGGIKEKVLAAHRAGIQRVILPKRNEKDIVEIPKEIRDDLEIHLVSNILEAMQLLFSDEEPVTIPAWIKEIEDADAKDSKKRPIITSMPPGTPSSEESSAQNGVTARDLCGPILDSSL